MRAPALLWAIFFCVTVSKAEKAPRLDFLILPDPTVEVGANAEYTSLYERKLLMTPGDLARFVQLPGPVAQTEVTVSVYRKGRNPDDYWVTFTEPSRRLADCDPIDPALPKVDPNTIGVRRYDARLPASTALAVHNVWLAMLRRAKSCSACSGEGTIEIFSAKAETGKTLEALFYYSGPKTLELARLAGDLIVYCHSPADRQAKIAADIKRRALALQRRLST